jgi:ATP citrate (pro-S)-lyase
MYQQDQLKAAKVHVYVRRGGPNWERGLAKMRALSEETNVPIEVLFLVLLYKS